MKIAARFPVKSYLPYVYALSLLHLFLFGLSFYVLALSWKLFTAFIILSVSGYFSVKYYQSLVRAPDDLCRTSDSWLMQHKDKMNVVSYLELKPQSWTARHLSLLHFSCNQKDYCWLFSRAELGDRLYSKLIYLVKYDLAQSIKQDLNKH